ncbi:MAG: hypothetical protein KGL39_31300, partial [Patescibacteria group bacterium]|nr:hypothetical protein [Patescibacteria group bacterium]
MASLDFSGGGTLIADAPEKPDFSSGGVPLPDFSEHGDLVSDSPRGTMEDAIKLVNTPSGASSPSIDSLLQPSMPPDMSDAAILARVGDKNFAEMQGTNPLTMANKALGYAGNITRAIPTDVEMGVLQPSDTYAGQFKNTIAAVKGQPLPQDVTLKEISAEHPIVASAGKIAQGVLGTAPMLAIAGLPEGAAKLASLGFSAQMIKSGGDAATALGEEMGKPPEQRDMDKITSAVSDLSQSALFAPLAAKFGATDAIESRVPPNDFVIRKLAEQIKNTDIPNDVGSLRFPLGTGFQTPEGVPVPTPTSKPITTIGREAGSVLDALNLPEAQSDVPANKVAPTSPQAQETPIPPKGEQLVTIQRADGTTYPASVSGKFYDHPKRGQVPSVARLMPNGEWSHGMLGADETILPTENKGVANPPETPLPSANLQPHEAGSEDTSLQSVSPTESLPDKGESATTKGKQQVGGEPMPPVATGQSSSVIKVYHGGTENALESNWPKWFTTSKEKANAYTQLKPTQKVFEGTVNPKNPLYSKVTLSAEDVERAFQKGHDAIIIG